MQTDRWADGQTDMTKLIVGFHNFANARKKKAENSTLQVSLNVVNLYIACKLNLPSSFVYTL
jgi:hypothetical protein